MQLCTKTQAIWGTFQGRSAPARFTGKKVAYRRSLEVGKNFHMLGPVGNTGLCVRGRSVQQQQVAYRRPSFGIFSGHIGLLEVGRILHMG